jgi:hypothetical protein
MKMGITGERNIMKQGTPAEDMETVWSPHSSETFAFLDILIKASLDLMINCYFIEFNRQT